jgi:3-dehydroquinate dehydratase II
MRNRVEVIHGVNLDMLGRRDPKHYGTLTLTELEVRVGDFARDLDLEPRFFHTNSEAELVERLHRLDGLADGILLNAGAWTHYAWSLRDALEIASLPTVEIHLSDVSQREEWRRQSVFEGLTVAAVSGHGLDGYREALALLRKELGV